MNNLLANINRINAYDKSVIDDFKSLFLVHMNFMTLREMIISTRKIQQRYKQVIEWAGVFSRKL